MMQIPVLVVTAATLLATGAAAAQNAPDIDFVRGCWVDKGVSGAAPQAFLRLLPGAPDGTTLSGMVTPATPPTPNPPVQLSFRRDGSKLTLQHPLIAGDMPAARMTVMIPPTAKTRATFAAPKTGESSRWVVVEGGGDTLSIFVVTAQGAMAIPSDVIFTGERDGCD